MEKLGREVSREEFTALVRVWFGDQVADQFQPRQELTLDARHANDLGTDTGPKELTPFPGFNTLELLDQEYGFETDQPMPRMAYSVGVPLPDVVHTKRRLFPWFPPQLWKTALVFVFRTRMFLLRNRNDAGSLAGLKRKTAPNDETNPRA